MLVAVYGTLKKGFYNSRLLEGCLFKGRTTLTGFTMYDLGPYPAVTVEGEGFIHCEVYEIDQPVRDNLDRLEGYPALYDRISVQTIHGVAYIYVMSEDNLANTSRGHTVVHGGDWQKK